MAKKSPNKKKEYPCKEEGCTKVYASRSGLCRHRNTKHTEVEELKDKLNSREEDFCMFFASDREMFGNGVQSYIEAFEIIIVNKPSGDDPNEKTYQSCRQAAHVLLTNRDILKRINEIFEGRGLNNEFVDKQLEKVITQDAEFNPKMRGIQEYNKMMKRTTDTIEHTHSFKKYEEMGDDELDKEIAEGEDFFKKK